MLRKQILMPEWMDASIKEWVNITDQSEGEVVRALVCIGIITSLKTAGYDIDNGDVFTALKELSHSVRDTGGLNYIYTFAGNDFIVAFGTNYIDSGVGDDFVYAFNRLDDDDDLFDLLARSR